MLHPRSAAAIPRPGGLSLPLRVLLATMVLCLCTLAGHGATASDIYVWKDEHGVLQMRDKRPPEKDQAPSRLEQRRRLAQEQAEQPATQAEQPAADSTDAPQAEESGSAPAVAAPQTPAETSPGLASPDSQTPRDEGSAPLRSGSVPALSPALQAQLQQNLPPGLVVTPGMLENLQQLPPGTPVTPELLEWLAQLPSDLVLSPEMLEMFLKMEAGAPEMFTGQGDFPGQMPALSPLQLLMALGLPLLLGLVFYLFISYVLYRVGRKFGIGSFLGYCIPIYQVVLLCRCAGYSGWYTLFLFVPLVNIVFTFLIWGRIAERLGKNMVLWGLLCTILGLPVLFLAFDSSRPAEARFLP